MVPLALLIHCSPDCCDEGRAAGGKAEKLGCCVDCHGSSCTTDSLLELVLEVPLSVFDCLLSLTLTPLPQSELS